MGVGVLGGRMVNDVRLEAVGRTLTEVVPGDECCGMKI